MIADELIRRELEEIAGMGAPRSVLGRRYTEVLQSHGYEFAGKRGGIRGEPGERWHRGGTMQPVLGGGMGRFGADKVDVIRYGPNDYAWSHQPAGQRSTAHGASHDSLHRQLEYHHGAAQRVQA